MSRRRSHSSKDTDKAAPLGNGSASHEQHEHEHEHTHTHTHSLFGSHSHSHGEEGHIQGEKIVEALQGRGDRGSQITLVGLFVNIILTAAKGGAGWYMHSASLLADAGHAMSDLLGDFVVLFCWKLSRKPPSQRYPYGFAKFETLGTTTVSLLLIGGALGIGFHSYYLLADALSEMVAGLAPGPLQEALYNVTVVVPQVPAIGHGHAHTLDPNAAWFAAVSIVAKEWLYRATKKVADAERSPVLLANAVHHRSDAYSSIVAFFAILGSWYFPAVPLDPIGGLVVSLVILRQGLSIFGGAWAQLTDAGVSPRTLTALTRILDPLLTPPTSTPPPSPARTNEHPDLLAVRHLRAKRAGSMMFVDLTAEVSGTLSVAGAASLEQRIAQTLKDARNEVAEVRVRFRPVENDHKGVSH